ncbi:MAG: hypothetical protein AAB461_03180 [Patescibacteria group bacterium]
MNLKYNKWTILISLVVVAAVAFIFSQKRETDEVIDELSPTPSVLIIEEVVNRGKSAVVDSGTADQTAKYTQLIKDYEGRRVQFDIRCQAIPPNTTYKNNTKVMFDNRSGDARVITIGGVKYNFPGYGYKILNIYGSKLPASVSFDCGAAVNVGSILIQK